MESPARLSIHRTPTQRQMKMIGRRTGSCQDGPCLETSDYSSPRSRRHRRKEVEADILLSEGPGAKFWLFTFLSLVILFLSSSRAIVFLIIVFVTFLQGFSQLSYFLLMQIYILVRAMSVPEYGGEQ
ncbi:hypothetical protein BDDG_13514 [Blastomyces dermatitidis ATCC 18188]|uniref:Uncharacterized protein n=1 Tax=Ajellomyces dermatitidis (strain ATCC 18188 / CBS 674.68) TaxID=653446 RepID=A0A0J9EVZ8_AJEDA|nr:hypothetical protein BDDG_13514 [Blastomyces dermatitidis ATCC 18188]